MENIKVKIELTVIECNVVLNALAARPYGEVVDLISSIKLQGERAVAEASAPAPEAIVE